MQQLAEQQEIMGALADCIIEVYAMESCYSARGKAAGGERSAGAQTGGGDDADTTPAKAFETVERSSRKVIAAVAEGDMLRTQMAILRRLAKHEPADTIGLGREIARHVIEAGRYTV